MESSQGFTMALKNKVDVSYKHEVNEVFELAAKHRIDANFFEVKRDGPIHKAIFTIRLTAGRFTAEAQGPTKIIAKTLAAQQILPDLRALPLPERLQRENNAKKKLWQELPAFKQTANPISCLHEIITNWRGKPTEYTVVNVDREFDPWVFYVRLTVTDKIVVGAGNSKREAKQNAAAKVLNTFGYNFLFSEPENTKEELLAMTEEMPRPVTQNTLSEEAVQGDRDLEVRNKTICPVSEELQPEENVQPSVEGPQDSTPAQGNMAQCEAQKLPLFDLQQPSADVLDNSAGMELIEDENSTVQLCELVLKQENPLVSQDNTSTPESDTSTPEEEIHLEESQSVDSVPQEDTEDSSLGDQQRNCDLENVQEPSPIEEITVVNQQSPEATQENTTSQTEANDEPQGEDVNPQHTLELQTLFANVQPLLDFMGVRTDDLMDSSQNVCSIAQTTPEEEKREACPAEDTPMPEATDVSTVPKENTEGKRSAVKRTVITVVINMATVEPASVGEDSLPVPVRSDPPASHSERPESCVFTNSHQPTEPASEDSVPVSGWSDTPTSSSDCNVLTEAHQHSAPVGEVSIVVPGRRDAPPSSSGRPVSYILSNALVKKVFKMAGSHSRQDSNLMVFNLNEKVREQLIIGRECDISFKDLQKIGKTAAKRLALDHSSAHAVLKAAAEDTAALEGDVVRHLNMQLEAFLNQPKSASGRFFTRLRRFFCFS